MKVRALCFAILISLAIPFAIAAPADAGPRAPGLRGALNTDIVVPAEWSGVWSYVDSTYDCLGVPQGVDSGLDTLCTGQGTSQPDGSTFQLVCTGSITATTFDTHCTGSGPIEGTECTLSLTLDSNGTRTSDSYVITSTIASEVTGIAPECSFFPGSCMRIVSRATRIAAEPTAYCATPVAPTTWGRVKSQYR